MVSPLRRLVTLFGFILLAVFLVGCQGSIPGVSPSETPAPSPTSTPSPTETPTPTATPLPPVGLLLAPPQADSKLASEVQSLLSAWIPAMDYRFQVRPSITDTDLSRDDFRLVVALAPNPEIAMLAASHPEIQFLAIGIQGIEAGPNLSTIGADGERLDYQGFIAGYIAAIITPDWRVGVIGNSGSDSSLAARQAFYTGVKFYCGLCLPSYPPFYEYPLYFELGSDADTIAWRTAADNMINRSVTTVYIVPGAGDDEMLRHLSQAGVNIIAGQHPLAEIQDRWVATLSYDLVDTFIETWPDFSAGSDSLAVTLPLRITEVNSNLLSPGKQRVVEETLADMLEGYIDLGVDAGISP